MLSLTSFIVVVTYSYARLTVLLPWPWA